MFPVVHEDKRIKTIDRLQKTYGLDLHSTNRTRLACDSSLNRKQLTNSLHSTQYIAHLSTNGVRVLLVLLDDFTCVFVNRDIVVNVRARFEQSLFEGGSVLQGELIRETDTGKLLFMIDDVLVLRGDVTSTSLGLSERYSLLLDILRNAHQDNYMFGKVRFMAKHVCVPHDLSPLLDLAARLPYISRFICLRPVHNMSCDPTFFIDLKFGEPPTTCNVRSLQHRIPMVKCDSPTNRAVTTPSTQTCHKSRPKLTNQVMLIRKTDLPDVYEVSEPNDTNNSDWNIACVPTLTTSKMLRDAFVKQVVGQVSMAKCSFNTAFLKWEPIAMIESFPQRK